MFPKSKEIKEIEELEEIAELYPDCVGFNSWGYLKNKIASSDKFIPLANRFYNTDGLFVKKSYFEETNSKLKEESVIKYNQDIVNKLTEQINLRKSNPNPNNKLTFTITTCKRFDLFEKTINSFLNCCLDIDLIDEFIGVDDNSSKQDRKQMKKLYFQLMELRKT